jgi:hypothetical protein
MHKIEQYSFSLSRPCRNVIERERSDEAISLLSLSFPNSDTSTLNDGQFTTELVNDFGLHEETLQ